MTRPSRFYRRQEWMERAACHGKTDLFFAPFMEQGKALARRELQAKRICVTCEVRDECLAYAFAHPKLEGTWGGFSERERESWRGARRRAARRAAS